MAVITLAWANLMPMLIAQPPAQRAASPNIAVINLAAVFERYQITQDLEQMFAERREEVQAEAQRKQDEVNGLRTTVEQFKPGSADYRSREEDLVRAEINFQVWLEVQERRLKSEHKAWLELIYRNTQAVVAKIAADRHIDLVLTYSDLEEDAPDSVAFKQQILLRTVIYANQRADLTEQVIEMLDADYQRRGGAAALKLGQGGGPGASPGGGAGNR